MSLVNKKKDMTPFDMRRKPSRQNPLLLPIIWGASYFSTIQFHLKIEKVNMKGLKPPFLVLSTHQGFQDYCIGPLSLFPRRAMYVSDMEGFAAFGNSLYRGIGCIGKRRYVPDLNVALNVKNALKEGNIVVIYPESRHSNIGITSKIPGNIGKFVKAMDVPLVILSAKGSYLANPFWQEEITRKVPIKAKIELVLNKEEVRNTDPAKIQEMVEERLKYDEYEYQHKEGFKVTGENRAKGLELPLFSCISCGKKYSIVSSNNTLSCTSCGRKWLMSEDGWLVDKENNKIHLPDWYKEEIRNVEAMLDESETFERNFEVKIEALPNEHGFIELGNGTLILNEREFVLTLRNLQGIKESISFPHKTRESVQTEYNYRGKGKAIVLSTKDCCYYIYSENSDFSPTEIQFIGELLYDRLNK